MQKILIWKSLNGFVRLRINGAFFLQKKKLRSRQLKAALLPRRWVFSWRGPGRGGIQIENALGGMQPFVILCKKTKKFNLLHICATFCVLVKLCIPKCRDWHESGWRQRFEGTPAREVSIDFQQEMLLVLIYLYSL